MFSNCNGVLKTSLVCLNPSRPRFLVRADITWFKMFSNDLILTARCAFLLSCNDSSPVIVFSFYLFYDCSSILVRINIIRCKSFLHKVLVDYLREPSTVVNCLVQMKFDKLSVVDNCHTLENEMWCHRGQQRFTDNAMWTYF